MADLLVLCDYGKTQMSCEKSIYTIVLSEDTNEYGVDEDFGKQLFEAKSEEEFVKVWIEMNLVLSMFYKLLSRPWFPIRFKVFETYEG